MWLETGSGRICSSTFAGVAMRLTGLQLSESPFLKMGFIFTFQTAGTFPWSP